MCADRSHDARADGVSPWGVLLSVLLGTLVYLAYQIAISIAKHRYGMTGLGTDLALYPVVSLVSGVVIGYRIRRRWWLYAWVPAVVLCIPGLCLPCDPIRYVVLSLRLPVGAVASTLAQLPQSIEQEFDY